MKIETQKQTQNSNTIEAFFLVWLHLHIYEIKMKGHLVSGVNLQDRLARERGGKKSDLKRK